MSKQTKKLFTVLLALVLALTFAMPTFAGSVGSEETITLDGITYTVMTSVDLDGNKVVTVSGGGETSSVIFDGQYLHLTLQDENTMSYFEHSVLFEPAELTLQPSTTFSNWSPFWNYNWSEFQSTNQNWGLYWNMSSGNTHGRHSGFDYNNATARSYARSFAREVDEIANQQWIAIGMIGFAAASVAAGIVASVASFGITAIVAALMAAGGAIATAGYWYSAWSASNRANRDFNRAKPLIHVNFW